MGKNVVNAKPPIDNFEGAIIHPSDGEGCSCNDSKLPTYLISFG